MRRVRIVLLLSLPLLLLSVAGAGAASPSAPGVADPAVPFEAHENEECLEPVPDSAAVQGVTDDGRRIALDVLVALDHADGAEIARLAADEETAEEAAARLAELAKRTRALLEPAETTYAPLGVDVRWTFELLAPLDASGQPRKRDGSTAASLIALAKSQYGGRVPQGYDLVYALTDLDVSGSVAGQADCIGGVRYRNRAFGYGEIDQLGPIGLGPLRFFPHITAKVAAHEIAHLLGAHHHYANCVEGVPTEPVDDAMSLCTLMINDVGLASLNLSVVNGAVVRGHAVKYAAP